MLPPPRIIIIDDDPQHLRGLADGLNGSGAACLQVRFTGDDDVKHCPHVRVIFADLHLTDGGSGDDHTKHFAVIGGLIESSIVPSGPYAVVLWTRFADQAKGLEDFLRARLGPGIARPFLVTALDKVQHLDAKGAVKDASALIKSIEALFTDEPQLRALLDWEERVLGAAAATVSSLLELVGDAGTMDTRRAALGRILRRLGLEAVGSGHLEEDRFRAVNEALLPILADRIAFLRAVDADSGIWEKAFEGDGTGGMSEGEAGTLNRLLHLGEGEQAGTGADRGAVVDLPDEIGASFEVTFGMNQGDAAGTQFGCKDYADNDGKFRWKLVQIQAACDYAQQQPGSLPYLLGLEMLAASKDKAHRPPASLWQSAPLEIEKVPRVLHVNSRFEISLTKTVAGKAKVSYRLRESLLNDLIYQAHSQGARPGVILFHDEKPKAQTATLTAGLPRKSTAKPGI